MEEESSISCWISGVKAGDEDAAQRLWEAYFSRLVALCHNRLRNWPCKAKDEEDAALSAFASFCDGARNGRFPQLSDRGDLWRILVVIAGRKAIDYMQTERAQKRGAGRVVGESALGDATNQIALQEVIGTEPTPEFATIVAEQYEKLLGCLSDESQRTVALRKLEGFTNSEIARELGCVRRTVDRKLSAIRKRWDQWNRVG